MSFKKDSSPCTNVLFVTWLEQWRNEAKERGLSSQYTYAKAAASMRKFPLPLFSGKEARIVENIDIREGIFMHNLLPTVCPSSVLLHLNTNQVPGEGIAKRLDEAISDILANGGDLTELHAAREPKGCKERQRKGIKRGAPGKGTPPTQPEECQAVDLVQNRHSKAKDYVPGYRTGAYALLVTLEKEKRVPGYKGCMSKEELQIHAQHLCDSSFTKPNSGSHYTAWSAMATLVKKGLTQKEGHPPRYSLTDAGLQLARRLEAIPAGSLTSGILFSASECIELDTSSLAEQSASTCNQALLDTVTSNEASLCKESLNFAPTANPASRSDRSFEYWYVNENSQLVKEKDRALVTFSDALGPAFLVNCRKSDLTLFGINHEVDTQRDASGDWIFVYIGDADATDTVDPADLVSGESYPSLVEKSTLTAIQDPAPKLIVSTSSNNSRVARLPKSSAKSSNTNDLLGQLTRSDNSVQDTEFLLQPGQFEVILCIDVNEVGGHGKKEQLVEQLRKNGVAVDVRKLQLGDFLWIAREKTGGKTRELVLDFIVERKRVDDLAGSIVDGRFKEQKFRLKECGLKHVVYLVEKYGSLQHLPLPEATLRQAVINTQIIDGLVVKWTDDFLGSVNFLTFMSKELPRLYKDKTLRSTTLKHFKNSRENVSYCDFITLKEHWVLNFQKFSELTAKNKVLTVSQMFAKHLLQIRGVQSEKAAALISAYPTLSHLYKAYTEADSVEGRENLLSQVPFGKHGKKIGTAISKQICTIYTSNVTQ